MRKVYTYLLVLFFLPACEEVIDIDLNNADPQLVVEGVIMHDSLALVRLSLTSSYFSDEGLEAVGDAVVSITDGVDTEELAYEGDGFYRGQSIVGIVGRQYVLNVVHEGKTYTGQSVLPHRVKILSVNYGKSNEVSFLNPLGETVFTISLNFRDTPGVDDHYMVRFLREGKLLEERYFMLTETTSNGGSFERVNDSTFHFAESIFCEEGEAVVELYSLDKTMYEYFREVDDILFWKRRAMPPVPYNPGSNVTGGAVGYFGAWGMDVWRGGLE